MEENNSRSLQVLRKSLSREPVPCQPHPQHYRREKMGQFMIFAGLMGVFAGAATAGRDGHKYDFGDRLLSLVKGAMGAGLVVLGINEIIAA